MKAQLFSTVSYFLLCQTFILRSTLGNLPPILSHHSFLQDSTDLLAVAIHEIGHNLGLDHSNVGNSIMYPFIQNNINGLHHDDIDGIQKLYGVPATDTRGQLITFYNLK